MTWDIYFFQFELISDPSLKKEFILLNIDIFCNSMCHNEITIKSCLPYFDKLMIRYFNEQYGNKVNGPCSRILLGYENYRIASQSGINLLRTNNWTLILKKIRLSFLTESEIKYTFDLIRSSQTYSTNMINFLINIVFEKPESYKKEDLYELVGLCAENISNFSIYDIEPTFYQQMCRAPTKIMRDRLYIVIEIIISSSATIIDERALAHLKNCDIPVLEPERFI